MSTFREINDLDTVKAILEVPNLDINITNIEYVNKENFESVIHEYKLPKNKSLECRCNEGFSNYCKQSHQHGYIVILSSGKKSILGNNCAKNKFDKDGAIRKGINSYRNKKAFQEKLGKLYQYKQNSKTYLSQINELKSKVDLIKKELDLFRNTVGEKVIANITRSSDSISIRAIAHTDKVTGEKKQPDFIHRIGSIKGKRIFQTIFFSKFEYIHQRSIVAFKQLALLDENKDPDIKKINNIQNNLREFNELNPLANQIVNDWTDFKNNDFDVLFFVVHSDCQNLVKYYYTEMIDIKAKVFIKQKEEVLTKKLNVAKIQRI